MIKGQTIIFALGDQDYIRTDVRQSFFDLPPNILLYKEVGQTYFR